MTLLDWLHHAQALLAAAPSPGPVLDPGSGEPPPEIADKVLLLLRWTANLATAAAVFGILYSAGRMAIAYRRGDDAGVAQLGWVLAGCILIGAAPQIVLALI